MIHPCSICLRDIEGEGEQHDRCLKDLFGKPILPSIEVDVARLHTLALAMVGRVTLSGVQRKISLTLGTGKTTLQLDVGPGRYILKPQAQTFPALPENEHLTMRLADLLGIATPPAGLIRLRDGTLAYITARFDRPPEGGKLRQEDFCQLAEKPPKEKYVGSAELCARIVRRFASEPGVEALKLFRLMVFVWWTGNGDMHLKNFSLLAGRDGLHRLSPAYDQVCTRLVIPDDDLALTVGGKKKGLTRRSWIEYGGPCGIPERAARRVLEDFPERLPPALDLIDRSFLDDAMKEAYRQLVTERTARLRSS